MNCQRYIRHRDIWDLRWLKQRGAKINPEYIKAKITDYNISDYLPKLNTRIKSIDDIISGKDFYNQMSRFLPADVLQGTLEKENFKVFLIGEITTLLKDTRQNIVGFY